jgi:major membrane immunogen (membrane-anchored lipoprotein)
MKKTVGILFALSLTLLPLFGCGESGTKDAQTTQPPAYKDGVYVGQSDPDDRGAYGEVTLTMQDGAVAARAFVTWQADGSIKDVDYGKVNGEISNKSYYEKAQLAVAAMETYARQYQEVKDLAKVDAISGATIAHDQFTQAVRAALDAAV